MSKIRQIKVNKDSKGRVQYYAQASDLRDGYYYATGNDYHDAGTFSRHLTVAEWEEAIRIATWDGEVHTVSVDKINEAYARAGIEVTENEQKASEVLKSQKVGPRKNAYAGHCIWCGRPIAARAGELIYLDPEDVRDDIEYGNARYAGNGWQVQCAGGCQPVFGRTIKRGDAGSEVIVQDQSSDQDSSSGNSLDETWNFYGLKNEGEEE